MMLGPEVPERCDVIDTRCEYYYNIIILHARELAPGILRVTGYIDTLILEGHRPHQYIKEISS